MDRQNQTKAFKVWGNKIKETFSCVKELPLENLCEENNKIKSLFGERKLFYENLEGESGEIINKTSFRSIFRSKRNKHHLTKCTIKNVEIKCKSTVLGR